MTRSAVQRDWRIDAMSERDLQDAVVERAHTLGYIAAHFRHGRTASGAEVTPVAYDGKGFPDLVLVGRGRVIFAEVKSAQGEMRPEQTWWGQRLSEAGAFHVVWTPAEYVSGEIEAELKRSA